MRPDDQDFDSGERPSPPTQADVVPVEQLPPAPPGASAPPTPAPSPSPAPGPGPTPAPTPTPAPAPGPFPPPTPAPGPTPAPPGGLATLHVQVTDATNGAPIAGATVLSSSDYGGQQTHVTDGAGVASLVAGVGFLVEVNVIAPGYSNNDHVVSIADASDHWYSVALARSGAAAGGGQPPGVPPVVVLTPGQLGPLSEVPSHVYDLPPAPAYTRATFEVRGGVPSITAQSFGALDIPGFGLSPSGILANIVSGLIGLFKGSSGSAEINRLAGVVQNMGQFVLQLASTLADYTARAVHTDRQGGGLFDHILGGVLGPIINALAAVIRGGSSDLGKLFGPITDSIKKLVGIVRRLYDTWLRPIIKAIDTTRQILRVLESFHLKWAAEADAALGRLEGKLSAPLLKTIQQLNKVSNVVNRIVTLDGALQRVTLLKGMTKHATCVQRAIDLAPMADAGSYAGKLPPPPAAMTLEEWRAGLTRDVSA